MRLLWLAVWILLPLFASAEDRLLLKEIVFPPNYEYAPAFDVQAVADDSKDWQGKRLLLVGSGDSKNLIEDNASSGQPQLHNSESMRLAHRRAEWLRQQLLAVGFEKRNLQVGSVADGKTEWGGVVRIYAIK